MPTQSTEASHSPENLQETPDPNHELTMSLITEEHPHSNDDWLSKQFSRFPYKLYTLWLILSSLMSLVIVCWTLFVLVNDFGNYRKNSSLGNQDRMNAEFILLLRSAGFLLLLFGSGEMLYAMKKRRGKIARKSFCRLRYSLMGLVTHILMIMILEGVSWFRDLDNGVRQFEYFTVFCAICIPILDLIGGSGVNEIFKKKYLLLKSKVENQVEKDEVARDFLKQNEAIESKVLKYDKQLNTWGYIVYKWWLKFTIVFEVMRICHQFEYIISDIYKGKGGLLFGELGLFISFCLSAWAGLEIEAVITTKVLKKSERALVLLKICMIASIMTYLVFGIVSNGSFDLIVIKSNMSLWYLFSFGYCCLIPIVNFVGARSLNMIIEQRDKFAQVLSFADNDGYL